ncbi:HNH endonuclease [Rhizobium sp. XQZ8]|uniref:HNH endonuclease n=1 Tax=Rhizobium populisoli TaxID=2859785 RepID=UPI001CA4D800|nr:HNH endonuclease [Rhizobium populisoli]MBW6426203.1 HNH endonuclease [Rhizobium populisoli]
MQSLMWRRLTLTEFRAMNGKAAPGGGGGGAMHISLGKDGAQFPIKRFLESGNSTTWSVETPAFKGNAQNTELTFAGNPNRRGGEWLIRDQFTHRHPIWSGANGFPKVYDPQDPPYIFVAKVGKRFAVSWATEASLRAIPTTPARILTAAKGVVDVSANFLERLGIVPAKVADEFDCAPTPELDFDPASLADARKRVFASIHQRQGQGAFRRKVLLAYNKQCALTGSDVSYTLDAAHIVPYKGKKTNTVSNGILLRTDVHNLFDIGLIGIDPDTYRVRIGGEIGKSLYAELDNKKIALPIDQKKWPAKAYLAFHFDRCRF